MPMKKILFIAATHGNEKIGLEVIYKLKKIGYDQYFDYLIANPRAFEKNIRFIDVDLNRSYPGKKYSKVYEKRLAFSNLAMAKKYRHIIDFHEASAGTENFIIVPRKKLSQNFPLQFIDLKKVLLWPNPKGPIGQVLSSAIELEFGMKNKKRKEVSLLAFLIAKKFLEKNLSGKRERCNLKNKQLYYVFGKLWRKDFSGNINFLKDFKETRIGEERFIPILTKQYLKSGIVCYKMHKV
jgi:succinylglutamate desuccinylase